MTMNEYANLYQTFLNLAHGIDQLTEFPRLSPDEKCLMGHLNVFWSNDQDIKVVEILNQVDHISPATVFRYLKQLRQKGYVQLEIDENDNRVKYIKPTQLTVAYFAEHGRLLLASSKTA